MNIITQYERAICETDVAWKDFCRHASDATWEVYCKCLSTENSLYKQLPQEYKESLDE